MVSLKEKVEVEIENITTLISELRKIKNKRKKSTVELAGMGSFLLNFYTGIENILKQILSAQKKTLPHTQSWHKDLLIEASKKKIISDSLKEELSKYLAFRHFFAHSYGFLLKEEKIKPLVKKANNIFIRFKNEINKNLGK